MLVLQIKTFLSRFEVLRIYPMQYLIIFKNGESMFIKSNSLYFSMEKNHCISINIKRSS